MSFSFVTISTTTGYGDLTAARTDVGRALAITEALIGQIYLVTVPRRADPSPNHRRRSPAIHRGPARAPRLDDRRHWR